MRKRLPDWLTVRRLAALIVLAFVAVLVVLTKLSSPPEFDLLAGPENTTFYQDAMLFKEILARDGVRLNVIETRGSVDNVRRLLEADGPTAAFVDAVGAIELEESDELLGDGEDPDADESPFGDLTSLGAIYLQPIWFFIRADLEAASIEDLPGTRFGVGPEGSTSRLMADLFVRTVGDDAEIELLEIGGADDDLDFDDVVDALRNDVVEIAFVVGQPETGLVDRLLRAPEVRPATVRRAEAYALHFQYLVPVRLPEGGHALGENIPEEDIGTVAASTELLVTGLFPPPLADLLLQATAEVHGGASLFTERNAFPNPDLVSIDLSASAARFYQSGPPLLRKVLPFRLATWIDRFIMVVVAFGSIIFALFSIIPRLIEMHLHRQLQVAYRRMENVEKRFAAGGNPEPLLAELDEIDESTSETRIHLRSTISSWLELRQFLYDLRERIGP